MKRREPIERDWLDANTRQTPATSEKIRLATEI
jgi:hypothetical protein